MAVTAQPTIFTYAATGAASNFPYNCRILDDGDLVVTVDDVEQVLDTDYTVSGSGDAGGGAVSFVTPPVGQVRIFRAVAPIRLTDYQYAGDFLAAVVNDDFDRLMMAIQDLRNGSASQPTANTVHVAPGEVLPALPNVAGRANRLLSFDASGNPVALLPDAADATGVQINLLAFEAALEASGGSALLGFIRSEAGAVARTMQAKLRDSVSVLDFGADPTGVADSTAAFNLATRATAVWSAVLQYNVEVPSGKYRIDGTVYGRKGQTLRGTGHGSYIDLTGNTGGPSFVLGRGLIAGVETDDAGGSPVKIENLWTEGGSATRGVIYTNAQGFSVRSMFMTFPGIGIECAGADGIISDIEIDQCLTGMQFAGAQNVTVSNFNIYLPNFAVVFGAACRDISFTGGIVEYPQYTGVYFNDASAVIRNIGFAGVSFVMNEQYATFEGFVRSRANDVEAQFSACSFRNWREYAVNQDAGTGLTLKFSVCVFDAERTTTAYTQSTTAKVLFTGVQGRFEFDDCSFRNLPAQIATINADLTRLSLNGGSVVNCDATTASQARFSVTTTQVPAVTVKNVVGFPYVFTSGGNRCAVLPFWGGSTFWKMAIKGNTQAAGDSNYSAAEEAIYSVAWMNAGGTKSLYVDKVLLWKTTARTNPGDLAAVACLGSAPGGAASTTTYAATGTICVAVPVSSASNFDFYAETAT